MALAGVLCSCSRRDCNVKPYSQLTASVKQWFPYKGNKILFFLNATMQEDTLQLKDYFSGDDEVWNGDECPSSRGEFMRGNIVDAKNNDTIRTEILFTERIYIERKNTWIHYYDSKQVLAQPNAFRRFETSVTLNGKAYNNVLVTECSPADNCPTTGITKFYFAKGKGLVAFERNGILWTSKD